MYTDYTTGLSSYDAYNDLLYDQIMDPDSIGNPKKAMSDRMLKSLKRNYFNNMALYLDMTSPGIRSTGDFYQSFSKYDIGMPSMYLEYPEELNKWRAKHQPTYEKVGAAMNQLIVGELIGGTIMGFGAILEIPRVIADLAFNEEVEYGNALFNTGKAISDFTREETPIYQSGERFSDVGWYLQGLVSIGSVASSFIPGIAVSKGFSLAGKALQFSDKAMDIMNMAGNVVGATAMRHSENMREGIELMDDIRKKGYKEYEDYMYTKEYVIPYMKNQVEHYKQVYGDNNIPDFNEKELLERYKIKTPEEIEKAAAVAFETSYKMNSVNFVFDLIQLSALKNMYSAVTRNNKYWFTPYELAKAEGTLSSNKIVRGLHWLATRPALAEATESVEEMVNTISQFEGAREADIHLGLIDKDGTSFYDRLKYYLNESEEVWDSALWGLVAGFAGNIILKKMGFSDHEEYIKRKVEEVASRGSFIKELNNRVDAIKNRRTYNGKDGVIIDYSKFTDEEINAELKDLFTTTAYNMGWNASMAGNVDRIIRSQYIDELVDKIIGAEQEYVQTIGATNKSSALKEEDIGKLKSSIKDSMLAAEKAYKEASKKVRYSSNDPAVIMELMNEYAKHDLHIRLIKEELDKQAAELNELKKENSLTPDFDLPINYTASLLALKKLANEREATKKKIEDLRKKDGDKKTIANMEKTLDTINKLYKEINDNVVSMRDTGISNISEKISKIDPDIVETTADIIIKKAYLSDISNKKNNVNSKENVKEASKRVEERRNKTKTKINERIQKLNTISRKTKRYEKLHKTIVEEMAAATTEQELNDIYNKYSSKKGVDLDFLNEVKNLALKDLTSTEQQSGTTNTSTTTTNVPDGGAPTQPGSGQSEVKPEPNKTEPTSQPTAQSGVQPGTQPTPQPSAQPTTQPAAQPTVQPTTQPTAQSTAQPKSQPTAQPTTQPTAQPKTQPKAQPTTQSGTPSATQPAAQPKTQPETTQAKPTQPNQTNTTEEGATTEDNLDDEDGVNYYDEQVVDELFFNKNEEDVNKKKEAFKSLILSKIDHLANKIKTSSLNSKQIASIKSNILTMINVSDLLSNEEKQELINALNQVKPEPKPLKTQETTRHKDFMSMVFRSLVSYIETKFKEQYSQETDYDKANSFGVMVRVSDGEVVTGGITYDPVEGVKRGEVVYFRVNDDPNIEMYSYEGSIPTRMKWGEYRSAIGNTNDQRYIGNVPIEILAKRNGKFVVVGYVKTHDNLVKNGTPEAQAKLLKLRESIISGKTTIAKIKKVGPHKFVNSSKEMDVKLSDLNGQFIVASYNNGVFFYYENGVKKVIKPDNVVHNFRESYNINVLLFPTADGTYYAAPIRRADIGETDASMACVVSVAKVITLYWDYSANGNKSSGVILKEMGINNADSLARYIRNFFYVKSKSLLDQGFEYRFAINNNEVIISTDKGTVSLNFSNKNEDINKFFDKFVESLSKQEMKLSVETYHTLKEVKLVDLQGNVTKVEYKKLMNDMLFTGVRGAINPATGNFMYVGGGYVEFAVLPNDKTSKKPKGLVPNTPDTQTTSTETTKPTEQKKPDQPSVESKEKGMTDSTQINLDESFSMPQSLVNEAVSKSKTVSENEVDAFINDLLNNNKKDKPSSKC